MSPEDQQTWHDDAEAERREAHEAARAALVSHLQAEKVPADAGGAERARVAKYAAAINRASYVVDVPEWIQMASIELARTVIALADSEQAALVAEIERLAIERDLWKERCLRVVDSADRAEAALAEAHAQVEAVRALADEWRVRENGRVRGFAARIDAALSSAAADTPKGGTTDPEDGIHDPDCTCGLPAGHDGDCQ